MYMYGTCTKKSYMSFPYPQPDHGECSGMRKQYSDGVGMVRGEGSQPHVEIVSGLVDSIKKVANNSRITVVLW